MKRILGNTYTPTIGEECANTISHGVMAILTLFTIPFAILWAFHLRNSYLDAVGVSIYMISIFSMFSVSTLYHMMPEGTSIKEKWHLFDHIFIYVAIAGCYTPPSLSIIGGTWGIVVVVLQWTIVLLGTFYKIFAKKPRQFVSLAIYISMGWMIVLFLPTLLKQKNDLASILNNNILLCYTPVQIRLSLEKILSKYSLLEVTGSNGYKMLYKIANKKF